MTPQGKDPQIGGAMPDEIQDALLPMHIRLDGAGRLLHAGPTIQKMLGETAVVGVSFFDLFDVRQPAGVDDATSLMQQSGKRLGLALHMVPDMGLRGTLAAFPNQDGAIIDLSLGLSFSRAVRQFSLTLNDFSPSDQTVDLLYLHEANAATARLSRRLTGRLQAARAAAEAQARTDALTGLANRRSIDADVTRFLEDPGRDFSLLHLDLDLFKAVNDTHGHAAGDAVLVAVGRILHDELRRNDIPARIGGDEFLIVLQHTVEPAVAGRVASRLIRCIEKPIMYNGIRCEVSASVGLVTTAQYADRPTLKQMMQDVDAALYRAKNSGRGRYCMHNTLEQSMTDAPGS